MKKPASNEFPNDKYIQVIRANLTTYRAIQSEHLMRVHKWDKVDVRLMQKQEPAPGLTLDEWLNS